MKVVGKLRASYFVDVGDGLGVIANIASGAVSPAMSLAAIESARRWRKPPGDGDKLAKRAVELAQESQDGGKDGNDLGSAQEETGQAKEAQEE